MSEINKVILVDVEDNPLGEMDKLVAHQKGVLHRAFSIFIFNAKGEMLIHQRAASKYHGADLWTNACCSHPEMDKTLVDSAKDRLKYEMGIECEISEVFSFIYKAEVENKLIEHEFDHVFVGYSDAEPIPNKMEVQNYKWIKPEDLIKDLKENQHKYTYWFKTAFPNVMKLVNFG